MKQKIILFIAGLAVLISSCKKLTDLNVDKKSATEVPAETLFSNGERGLVDQITTPNNNLNVLRLFSQYWAATTYPDESKYDLTTRLIPDNEFRTIYRDVLNDLKEAKRIVDTESSVISSDAQKKNKKAIADILMVYSYQRLVDIFGNVPYEQSLDITNISPAYDDAQTIYAALFARLDADIADLDVSTGSYGAADIVYGGNVGNWKKFANSLKLKMAITVADVPALDPAGKASAAIAGGVFTSAADNATFAYLGAQPNTNPIYVNLVASDRFDWVPSNTIVDVMNDLVDPRSDFYFIDKVGGVYKGGVYGTTNTYSLYSHLTKTIQAPTWKGILLDFVEVQFYQAEAAARGFIAGSPETFYNAAITSSIAFWTGSTATAAAYLANPKVDYNDAASGATYKEKIAKQAWLAYFDRGDIAWTTWRRLDGPTFNPPPGQTLADIPTRYTYPIGEQTLNGDNYNKASAAIGGDSKTTKLFWDKF